MTFFNSSGTSEIIITHGPEDVTVKEGNSTSFPCFISGTNGVPFWKIGEFVFTTRNLPRRHYYSNSTLTVTDVQQNNISVLHSRDIK